MSDIRPDLGDLPQGTVPLVSEHLPEPNDGRVPCPDCGKRYFPNGMGVHRAATHGYKGMKKSRKPRTPATKPAASNGSFGPGRPPKVDLTVDDIFDVVVGQMFPRGSVPIHALTPLLRWRHATDEMLDEVLHGK